MAYISKVTPLGSTTTYDLKDNKALRTYTRNDIGTSPNFDDPGINGLFEVRTTAETTGETGTKPVNSFYPMLTAKSENVMLQLAGTNGSGWYIRGKQAASVTLSGVAWQRLVTNSGTWDISISGNAATATKATQDSDGNNIASTYLTKTTGVTAVSWDTTNKKITRTINGTAGNVVQFAAGSNITLTAESGKLTITSSYTNSRDPGYGKIKAGTASTATTAITTNTSTAEASTYNETLTINPGNKWIAVAASNSTTTGSDTFTIGHAVPNSITNNGPSSAQTPSYGSTFNIPVISLDQAGHVTGINVTTVKIPASDNTNNAVTQTNQTASNEYRIILSGTADDTTRTERTNKSTNLRFNPSTKVLSVGGSISASGNLSITGNSTLSGETSTASLTAGSLLVTGATSFTQIPTAPTATAGTNDTQLATTAFVMNAFTANDAMVFKGVINANSALPATHYQGWTYRIGTAGTYANKVCEVGDIIICVTDGTAANNDHWAVIQNNVDGAVFKGTNSFTDNNIIIADSTAGKVKSSGKTISTTAPSSSSGDTTIPTSKAVWSAISGASGYGKTGTVTSVQVQATSPVVSSTSTASTTTLNTTISLANNYGDTKNPYGNKNANVVLAGPSSGNAAAPTFRSLVAADIPKVNNAITADKLGSSDVGSNVKAIYLDDGVAKASDHEFAGGYQKNNANLNTLYDSGFYSCPGGSLTNYPTGGSTYGTILVAAYRKPSGNTTPDYAWQMGNFTQNTDRLWYRTSQANVWRDWRQFVNIATNTAVGGTTTPVYVNADGAVTALSYTIAKSVPSDAVFTDTNKYHKTGSWSSLTYTATAVNSADELKFTIPTGTTSTTVALGNHTHTLTIAADSGTNALTLAHGTKYKITAGGSSFIFTMPASGNTDTKQNIKLATTSKAYITGVTTKPTSSNQALEGVADTGVYLTATAGEISAVRHSFNNGADPGVEKAYITFNTITNALDFIFI